jgi:flagellar basal-body rod protein FlgB
MGGEKVKLRGRKAETITGGDGTPDAGKKQVMFMFRDELWQAGKLGAAALAARFEATAENLANINTPGYERKEVFFEDALREALSEGDPRQLRLATTCEGHISPGKVELDVAPEEVIRETSGGDSYRLDENTVDPEVEMAKLAETRMAYNAVMRLMAKRTGLLKTAMGGK